MVVYKQHQHTTELYYAMSSYIDVTEMYLSGLW